MSHTVASEPSAPPMAPMPPMVEGGDGGKRYGKCTTGRLDSQPTVSGDDDVLAKGRSRRGPG
ncbi:hypothetical protein ANO14919_088810 [Xylariales sp. No.14919]|nr:hypothetical protein ANO14919_088810 [Xylariales sp. No.14919]